MRHHLNARILTLGAPVILPVAVVLSMHGAGPRDGRQLFEEETFNGNGRTCLTCHSRETGTLSPQDAQRRFAANPRDPLFLHDGSDDGFGKGVRRMLTEGTVLVSVPLHPDVSLANNPSARSVVVRRGIPSTLNTPALDRVLMLDGREPDLRTQASNAILGHYQAPQPPLLADVDRISQFELTNKFFSSPALHHFALSGTPPRLPEGKTASEKRGRRFFEDLPPSGDLKGGLCATCHSGLMLNQTNGFLPVPVVPGTRFQSVLVSELNTANNPVYEFIFRHADGSKTTVRSPDPGRALITGNPKGFENLNAFKIPSLWGVRRTAPYFHDNSAKTLEQLMEHYAKFFAIVTDPKVDGDPPLILTPQDQADMIAFLKLLD
jgi:hypothetical protein